MKRFVFVSLLFLFIFSVLPAVNAQLAVSMHLDRQNYIMYEHIYAKVSFRNYSGRGLVFGKNKALRGKLTFKITAPDGRDVVIKQGADPSSVLEGIVLNPGATVSVVVCITKMYNISRPGQYTIRAVVSHPLLPKSYVSDPKASQNGFGVFNGIKVWEREVGIPDVLNLNSGKKIKKRKVEIMNFYDNRRKYYALMIEDDRFVYGVVRLAEDMEDKLPHVEIDGLSRIHILVQISAKVYSYFVYDIDCRLEEFSNYKVSRDGIIPVLVRDEDEGAVRIVGGEKAVNGRDFVKEDPNPVFSE